MKKLFFFCCLSLLLISCGKSFLEPGEDVFTGPALRKITQAGKTNTEFTYNAKGQLVKITGYSFPGGVASERVHRYDDAGLLVKIETSINISSSSMNPQYSLGYSEMFYDTGKKLTETKNYRLENGVAVYAGRTVPEYDAQGRTVAVSNYTEVPNSQAFSKTTYEYNADGNIIKSEFFQFSLMPGASMTTTYEYDQKKNPFRGKWVFPYGANVNNIIKQVHANHIVAPGISNAPVTTGITIKAYNASGYPTLVNENGVDYGYEYQ